MSNNQKTIIKSLKQFKILILISLIVIFAITTNDILSVELKSWIFTISDLIKSILLFTIPFLIFPFMVNSIASLKKGGAYIILVIMLMVCISNFISIMIGYSISHLVIPHIDNIDSVILQNEEVIKPLLDFKYNSIISIEMTFIVAVITGLYLGFIKHNMKVDLVLKKYLAISTFFFEKIFIPTIPLYIFGLMIKITHETDFNLILGIFGKLILIILLTQLTYNFFLFYIGSTFNFKKALTAIKNCINPAIVGFSTMSSVVTLPFTLKAAEKNIPNHNLARLSINTTVNCHDVGECISLTMILLAIYFMNFGVLPPFNLFITFAFFMVLAQFGGVAVPGGSIIIILPLLTTYLSYNDEMIALIIAISLFTDPIGTANNVLGNSAFAMIINKIYNLRKIKKLGK